MKISISLYKLVLNYALLLQVPYELLNKKFRAAQKTIDREVSHVQNSASELDKYLEEGATIGMVSSALNGVMEKLTLLKRKASLVLVL